MKPSAKNLQTSDVFYYTPADQVDAPGRQSADCERRSPRPMPKMTGLAPVSSRS